MDVYTPSIRSLGCECILGPVEWFSVRALAYGHWTRTGFFPAGFFKNDFSRLQRLPANRTWFFQELRHYKQGGGSTIFPPRVPPLWRSPARGSSGSSCSCSQTTSSSSTKSPPGVGNTLSVFRRIFTWIFFATMSWIRRIWKSHRIWNYNVSTKVNIYIFVLLF